MAAFIGLLLTWIGVQLWVVSLPVTNWPYWFRWDIDARVVAFLTIVSAGTAIVTGLAPAVHLSRSGAAAALKVDARSGSTTPGARRSLPRTG